MHVQSCCFACLNLLLFCRSRCRRRRRRRCVNSLLEFETDKHIQSEKAQVQEVLGQAAEDQNQIRTSCW